jgi:HEPN domain-containing protein
LRAAGDLVPTPVGNGRDGKPIQVARALSDRQLANTAFHLQQAAEKILKGILAAGTRPFRKSHGLGELAAWVCDLHPDLAPELQDLDPCTSWVGAGRYLDARTDVPITRDTVGTLLQRCEALLAGAEALAPGRTGSA